MKGKMVQQMYAGTVINQRRDIIRPAHGLMLCIKIDKCVAHVTKHKRIIEFVTNSKVLMNEVAYTVGNHLNCTGSALLSPRKTEQVVGVISVEEVTMIIFLLQLL